MTTTNDALSAPSPSLFPWTVSQVKNYIHESSRTVDVKGHLFARFSVGLLTKIIRSLSWESAYKLGGGIGRLLYRLGIRGDVARINLDIVYGDTKTKAEKEKIFRDSMINFGHQIVNYLRIPLMDEKFWEENFTLKNEKIICDAYNQGKGVIFLYSHFGPWELPGGKIGHSGYPISVVAKKIKNPVIDNLVVEARKSMTLGTIMHKGVMKRILEGLSRGEGIIMVIDQNMKRSQGMFVKWMGTIASTVRSTAYIAKESGAPVITGYARQTGPKQFEMVMTESVPWTSHDDPETELRINTENYVEAVQKNIYKMPSEWFWLHRRWKIQPENTPNPYDKGKK